MFFVSTTEGSATKTEGDTYAAGIYLLVLGKTVRRNDNVKCFCYEAYSHVVHNSR